MSAGIDWDHIPAIADLTSAADDAAGDSCCRVVVFALGVRSPIA